MQFQEFGTEVQESSPYVLILLRSSAPFHESYRHWVICVSFERRRHHEVTSSLNKSKYIFCIAWFLCVDERGSSRVKTLCPVVIRPFRNSRIAANWDVPFCLPKTIYWSITGRLTWFFIRRLPQWLTSAFEAHSWEMIVAGGAVAEKSSLYKNCFAGGTGSVSASIAITFVA